MSHGAIELEIKLATIENQLAEANEELKRWRASGRPGGMSMNRKSTVSARHSLSLTSSTIAERDQYAEEAADAGSELKLLIGSSAGGRNNSELDVTNIDELLRQAGVKLAEEQRRRQEAETEMAELRQQVDRVSSELQKARTECERLTSDLANAARASGPAIFEALNDESANGDRQLLQTPPPQPGGGSGGRGGDASRRRKEKTRSFERFVELKREIIGLRESNDKLREELAQAIAIKEDAGRRTVVIVLNRNDRRQTTPHVEVFDDDLFSDSSSTGRRTPLQLQPIRNANSKLNAATKFGGRL